MSKQTIQYDNATIVQQAQNYTDPYRILAEYVDNSIDSAEALYDSITESYTRNIEIIVSITGTGKKDRKIIITDNSCGMQVSTNNALTIFKSDKQSDPTTNGMYGMGMFSFLAICKKMLVETKQSNSNSSYNFEISNLTFQTPNGKAPEFELINTVLSPNDTSSWTRITLSDFLPDKYEEINLETLKKEIEKHFELILKRKDIRIIIQENNGTILNAVTFDYSKISKNNYSKTIDKLYRTDSKKFNTKKEIDISKTPCKIFLVVSKNIEINRAPVFICKGRRVIEVSKVDQFRSNNRSSIWSNPNVTGYIDVSGILEPVPTRKDFKNTPGAKALYQALIQLEPEIKKFIDDELKMSLTFKNSKVEEKINTALNNFLQKSEFFPDAGIKYKEYTINSFYRKLASSYNETSPSGVITTAKGSQTKRNITNTSIKKGRDHKVTIRIPDNVSNSAFITIKIDNLNSPQTDITGKLLRSIYRDYKIIIYQKHPEFLKRLHQTRNGQYKFNDKSLQYVAMEIITHLKKSRADKEEDNSFVEFATAVYELENSLYQLNGSTI